VSRPRQPALRALVSGATVTNPARFEGRLGPHRLPPVGEPYARMNEAERTAWESFKAELPWLNRAHRAILQLACMCRVRIESGDDVGINRLQVYSAILSKLGATPADEARISPPEVEDEDEADRFFSGKVQ